MRLISIYSDGYYDIDDYVEMEGGVPLLLVGSNGAGKSSFLRLARFMLEEVARGRKRVTIDHRRTWNVSRQCSAMLTFELSSDEMEHFRDWRVSGLCALVARLPHMLRTPTKVDAEEKLWESLEESLRRYVYRDGRREPFTHISIVASTDARDHRTSITYVIPFSNRCKVEIFSGGKVGILELSVKERLKVFLDWMDRSHHPSGRGELERVPVETMEDEIKCVQRFVNETCKIDFSGKNLDDHVELYEVRKYLEIGVPDKVFELDVHDSDVISEKERMERHKDRLSILHGSMLDHVRSFRHNFDVVDQHGVIPVPDDVVSAARECRGKGCDGKFEHCSVCQWRAYKRQFANQKDEDDGEDKDTPGEAMAMEAKREVEWRIEERVRVAKKVYKLEDFLFIPFHRDVARSNSLRKTQVWQEHIVSMAKARLREFADDDEVNQHWARGSQAEKAFTLLRNVIVNEVTLLPQDRGLLRGRSRLGYVTLESACRGAAVLSDEAVHGRDAGAWGLVRKKFETLSGGYTLEFGRDTNPVRALVFRSKSGVSYSVEMVSGGLLEIFMIVFALWGTTSQTVLLDEPGSSLHPPSQHRLRDELVAAARPKEEDCDELSSVARPNGQLSLWVVTHSPIFISRNTVQGVRRIVRINDRSRVWNLHDVLVKDPKYMKRVLETPGFLFATGVHLVEGPTESRLLSAMAMGGEGGVMDSQWFTVQMGTCSSLPSWVQLLTELDVPFIVTVDFDAMFQSTEKSERRIRWPMKLGHQASSPPTELPRGEWNDSFEKSKVGVAMRRIVDMHNSCNCVDGCICKVVAEVQRRVKSLFERDESRGDLRLARDLRQEFRKCGIFMWTSDIESAMFAVQEVGRDVEVWKEVGERINEKVLGELEMRVRVSEEVEKYPENLVAVQKTLKKKRESLPAEGFCELLECGHVIDGLALDGLETFRKWQEWIQRGVHPESVRGPERGPGRTSTIDEGAKEGKDDEDSDGGRGAMGGGGQADGRGRRRDGDDAKGGGQVGGGGGRRRRRGRGHRRGRGGRKH